MSRTKIINDYRRMRELEHLLRCLDFEKPSKEYAELEREWLALVSKYGKSRKFNKYHRVSTRRGLRKILKKERSSRKRKDEILWKRNELTRVDLESAMTLDLNLIHHK